MSDNLRTYTKALYGFDATVHRVDADAWTNPSPCPDWTAADVVAHNIGMNRMIAGFTEGAGAPGPAMAEVDDPVAEWVASLDDLFGALDSQGALQRVAPTPWGEMAVDKFLGFAWVDPVIHTWDLARATGQQPTLDAALVARGAKQLERAGDSLVAPGRFDAAVTIEDGASLVDRFVAFSGRDPGTDD